MTTSKFNVDYPTADRIIKRLAFAIPIGDLAGEAEVRYKIQCIIDDLEESARLNEVAMVAEIGE
jgi:hypothetical protein|tara:strand:- start:2250 stop:2441 length:192 start_codon:yes stop_codon:yes gene_type:complete